jgi:hypothetical protein
MRQGQQRPAAEQLKDLRQLAHRAQEAFENCSAKIADQSGTQDDARDQLRLRSGSQRRQNSIRSAWVPMEPTKIETAFRLAMPDARRWGVSLYDGGDAEAR